MTVGAGVLRSSATMETLHARLVHLGHERRSTVPTPEAWETTNVHTVAVTLERHAMLREETRGGHWREDFPVRDDDHWRGHLASTLDPDGVLETKFQPMRETQ